MSNQELEGYQDAREWKFIFGILVGAVASLILTIIFYFSAFTLLGTLDDIVKIPQSLLEEKSSVLTICSSIVFIGLFKGGLRTKGNPEYVPENYRGLLLFFGRRLHIEVPEGLFWWFWPSFASVNVYDMHRQSLQLCFKEADENKNIVLPDGSSLKQADIDIIWQLKPRQLYASTEIGEDPVNYLKTIAEDRTRTGSNVTVFSIEENVKNNNYRGIDAMVLLASVSVWRNVISYGSTFPPEHPEGGDYTVSSEGYQRLTNLNKLIPGTGLIEDTAVIGITIHEIAISSAKLPDKIADAIMKQLTEITERTQETADTQTLLSLVDLIVNNSKVEGEPTIDRKDALNRAMLMQGKTGINIQIVEGSEIDPMSRAAAIFGASQSGGTQ